MEAYYRGHFKVRPIHGEGEWLQLKIFTFKMYGNIWSPPTLRKIYKAIKICYQIDYFLNYSPIEYLADAIHSEISNHPVLYGNPMHRVWYENMKITTFRASSLLDVQMMMMWASKANISPNLSFGDIGPKI